MQQELVERARRGDHDAFAALAGAAIFRLDAAARLILRDPDQAKDAVQETLVRAWRDLPTLRSPDRFDAWLHRLLYRACIDEARRLRRHASTWSSHRSIHPDRRRHDVVRSTTATSSNAASAASSRRRGRSSSFITISTCHCRKSPSCSGSRSGRRNRASTGRSSPCERRSTPMPDLGRRSRRAASHDAATMASTGPSRIGSTSRPGTVCPTTSTRSSPGRPGPDNGRGGRASKGGSPCRRRFVSAPAPRIAWLLARARSRRRPSAWPSWRSARNIAMPAPPFGLARNGPILYGGTDNDIHSLDPVTGATATLITGRRATTAPAVAGRHQAPLPAG